jgi:hypothetical protein
MSNGRPAQSVAVPETPQAPPGSSGAYLPALGVYGFGGSEPVNLALVKEREQPVLLLRLAAADLVDQNRLRVPHRRRRLKKPDASPVGIGVWETDEIVERDQARIVVSVFEVKCLRQRVSR